MLGRLFRRWEKAQHAFHHRMGEAFYRLGYRCADKPFYTIGLSLFVAFLLSLGWILFRQETDILRLWTNSESPVHGQKAFYDEFYPTDSPAQLLVAAVPDDADIFADGRFLRAWDLFEEIEQVSSPGNGYTLANVCVHAPESGVTDLSDPRHCATRTPFDFWLRNRALFANDTAPLQTAFVNPFEVETEAQFRFGGLVLDEATGFPVKSSALLLTLSLSEDDDAAEARTREWERRFLSLVDEFNAESSRDAQIRAFGLLNTFDDEVARVTTVALPALGGAVGLMILYLSFKLSRYQVVRSQISLGFYGLSEVFISLVAGFGLSFYLQIPNTSISVIVAFVVLAVALDDVVILVDSFAMADRSKPIQEQLGFTLKIAGPSITMTSLTSTFGFLFGATTRLRAVRYFCLNAAFILFLDYLLQITYFVAAMSIDHRRRESHRVDCFCCIQLSPSTNSVEYIRGSSDEPDEGRSGSGKKSPAPPALKRSATAVFDEQGKPRSQGLLNHLVYEYYAPFLLHPVVSGLVVALFLGIGILMAVRVPELKVGQDNADVVPNDSYILRFERQVDSYFGGRSPALFCVLRDGNDYTDPVVRDASLRLRDTLAADPVITSDPGFWLRDYLVYRTDLAGNASSEFYGDLDAFLSIEEFSKHEDDVVIDAATGVVVSSRMPMTLNPIIDGEQAAGDYRHLKRVIADFPELDAFMWNENFPFWDSFSVFMAELVATLLTAGAAVLIVLFVFLPPMVAVMVFTMIVVVDVELLGTMTFAGLQLNPVTLIVTVASIGLSVDFTSHIAHAFVEQTGSRHERTVRALGEMGVSVFNGAATTFLGVSMLAAAPAQAFWSFFVLFTTMIAFGVGHGLMLLPVILSRIGPKSVGVPGIEMR